MKLWRIYIDGFEPRVASGSDFQSAISEAVYSIRKDSVRGGIMEEMDIAKQIETAKHIRVEFVAEIDERKAAPTGGASPFAKASGDKEEDGK